MKNQVPMLGPPAQSQKQNITVALSGGGLRATLFQLGIFAQMARSKRLGDVQSIVAVSGGSIAAVHFALRWEQATKDIDSFVEVSADLVKFARSGMRDKIFIPWLWNLLLLGRLTRRPSRTDRLQAYYARFFSGTMHLLGGVQKPFVGLVATDHRRKNRVVFSANKILRMALDQEYKGSEELLAGGTPISVALAASSCFPPVFRPMHADYNKLNLVHNEFPDTLRLNDGGVVDNLGIEALRELHAKGSIRAKELVVCDAERPLGKLGTNSLANVSLGQTGFSAAARDLARTEFQAKFVTFRKRTNTGWLDFVTQTKLFSFRTDFDAPSPQEIHALLLHGYDTAWTSFEGRDPDEKEIKEGFELIGRILAIADCGDKLACPKESDLKRCSRRPFKRIAIHGLLVAVCAFILIAGLCYTFDCILRGGYAPLTKHAAWLSLFCKNNHVAFCRAQRWSKRDNRFVAVANTDVVIQGPSPRQRLYTSTNSQGEFEFDIPYKQITNVWKVSFPQVDPGTEQEYIWQESPRPYPFNLIPLESH